MEIWSMCWVSIISLAVISVTHWIYRWHNPKCNGKLPPGSMGFPLIGETIEFIIPSKSVDMPNFIKKRLQKYGKLFKTNLIGRPLIVSSNPEFNHYLLQQEGKLIERWYMDSFNKLLKHGDTKVVSHQDALHKYLRSVVLNHFGLEQIKQKLIPQLETGIRQRLQIWSKKSSIEIKKSCAAMMFDLSAKILFSYDPEKSEENLGENLSDFFEGFMSIPLNIPGTSFHKCLKAQKSAIKTITKMLNERRKNPEIRKGDFLDQIMDDMDKDNIYWDEEMAVFVTFWINIAAFETVSSTFSVAMQFLTDNPSVVDKLREEHEALLRNRESNESGLTWKEYKSMAYTHRVVNEVNRVANVAPGICRKAIKDIEVDGYTIPKDWIIMIAPASIHLNSDIYKDPLCFDPSRWENTGSISLAKDYVPFGGGSRACAGAEFSKVISAIFFHVLVTGFRWTKIKGGEVIRTPAVGFRDGYYIKITEKEA